MESRKSPEAKEPLKLAGVILEGGGELLEAELEAGLDGAERDAGLNMKTKSWKSESFSGGRSIPPVNKLIER